VPLPFFERLLLPFSACFPNTGEQGVLMPGCLQSYVTGLAKYVAKYVKNRLKNTIPTKDLTQFDTLTSLQYLSAGGVEKIYATPFP